MKNFDPVTMLAIASEALGIWLWGALAGLALVIFCYVAALLRGKRFAGIPFSLSLIAGILAVAAFAGFAPVLTDAGYGDLAAPADWVALLLGSVAAGFVVFIGVLPFLALLAGSRRAF